MKRVSVAVFAPGHAAARVAGFVEWLRAARPDVDFDVYWETDPERAAAPRDVSARLDETGWETPPMFGAVTGGLDPAVSQPCSECPTRKLERVILLPHPERGFADVPQAILAELNARWPTTLLVDRVEWLAGAPAGAAIRVTPRGRLWLDHVLAADLVIARTRDDAILANATLRPAVLIDPTGAPDEAWPFLWPVGFDQVIDRIDAYDPERGGPLLFNWKRAVEATARQAVDSWLRAAGR